MSLDKSLRKKGAMARVRNVLKRGERVVQLKDAERYDEAHGPFGLPKVRVMRLVAKKAKKEKKADDAAAGKDAKGAAAKAPAGKGAAPAAKAAAPAAKGKK